MDGDAGDAALDISIHIDGSVLIQAAEDLKLGPDYIAGHCLLRVATRKLFCPSGYPQCLAVPGQKFRKTARNQIGRSVACTMHERLLALDAY